MPESPTLRVITTLSLPARSLTSPYPSSCSSRTPSSSQSLFCSTAQPHLALPPPCLTPYPHHIVFRFPSPTPRSFPPSSISPSPSPSSSNSAHAYISSSFSLSPSSQSISSPLNLPSLHPEKTTQRDGRDNGSKGGMKIGRDKYPSTPLLIPQLLGNSRPRHTLLPPTLQMSTLHSPLGTTTGRQTKNQSPKQKGFASYLPLSPTPLLRKRLATLGKELRTALEGENRRETKGPEAKTAHLTVQPHPQGEELGSSFSKFDDRSGNRDGEGNGGVFGLREGDGGKGGDATSSTLDVKEEGEGRMRCERYERGEESEGGNKTWNGNLNSTEHIYPSFHSPAHLLILPNPTASFHLPPITKTTTILRPIHLLPPPP
ncbi:hypothetical protein I307_03134 [Cryptococcus deuterogattii 99/473]|nr:hypothetical protein I307_03134 [Cryptococcus deuterogattii 99/473]